MGEERDKSSKRGGGEEIEDQGGRGMAKVPKVTMKTKMLTLVK